MGGGHLMGGSTAFLVWCLLFYFLAQKYLGASRRRGFRGFHAKGADGFAKRQRFP